MIVADIVVKVRKIRTEINILKPTTLSLCLENEIEDKNTHRTTISLYIENELSQKHKIIITQKPTKRVQSTHKLHSLHPFI